jgi:ATP-dependent exoDNAse (exonuclease V) beta subunit
MPLMRTHPKGKKSPGLREEKKEALRDFAPQLEWWLSNKLNSDDLEEFFKILESLFASIPADIFVKEREGYYSTIIYLLLTLIGIKIKSEVHTNQGRIDAVIETEDNIYIMEYKLGTAEQALAQIKEMKYYEKFLISKKNIKLIGIGFDVEKNNIRNYKIEALQR